MVDESRTTRRSQVETFQWKTHCLFCSEVLMIGNRHPGRHVKVVNAEVCSQKNLRDKCLERGDKWAGDVERRMTDCTDLVASDAVYHKQCQSIFFTNNGMPGRRESDVEKTTGRPTNIGMQGNFDKLRKWLEKQTELFTIAELYKKTCFLADKGFGVYTVKRMKQKILLMNLVAPMWYFKDLDVNILSDKWYSEKKDDDNTFLMPINSLLRFF